MKPQLLILSMLCLINILASAQDVNIPNVNFKNYLVENTSINTNGDSEIQVAEAVAFTGIIDCGNLSISDLTGIESFVQLTELYCYSNDLTSIDLSSNLDLYLLDCTTNQLTTLDMSLNKNLLYLYSGKNQLPTLDVSSNDKLIELACDENQLTGIDLSSNPLLEKFYCHNNQFTVLDLTSNTSLTKLWCNGNQITSIVGISNSNLKTIFCYDNQLSSLHLTANTSLTDLRCNDNLLTSLNLASGQNSNISNLYSFNNPELTCIQVDDPSYSESSWTNIDDASSFSLDCGYVFLVNSIEVLGEGGNTTITTDNGTLQMQANVLPSFATDQSFAWTVVNGTGEATIDNSGLLTATAVGTVTVYAAANDSSGIIGSTVITISEETPSSQDNLAFEGLSIYPNPTSELLNISTSEEINSIKLFDLTGKILRRFNSNSTQLNISAYPAGFYYLEFANESKRSVIKLIKN